VGSVLLGGGHAVDTKADDLKHVSIVHDT
jgi:hypothetical protein